MRLCYFVWFSTTVLSWINSKKIYFVLSPAYKRLKAAPCSGGKERGRLSRSCLWSTALLLSPACLSLPHQRPPESISAEVWGQPGDRGMAGLLCSSLRGSAALQSFTANDRFWDGRDAHTHTHAHTEEAGACLSLGTPRKHMQAHTSHYQAQKSMVPSSRWHRALRGRRNTCTHGSAHVGRKQRRGSWGA